MSPSGDLAGHLPNGRGHRQTKAEAWDAFAPKREQHREWTRAVALPVTNWMVDAVAAQQGETVLELAAGAGDVGFAILERLLPGGRLSDVSPAVVEVARRAAAERGLVGIEFDVLDAQDLDMQSASVDAVVCRWGYLLMQDASAALRETARVHVREAVSRFQPGAILRGTPGRRSTLRSLPTSGMRRRSPRPILAGCSR